MSWTTGEIAALCDGQLQGDPSVRVEGVSTDTRAIGAGDLFAAIAGDRFDGHDFVAEAAARGAVAALVSRIPASAADLPLVLVEDTIAALGRFAARHRERFDGPVVAITGSNGKTTTKEMCSAILEAAGLRVHRTRGNLNNHIGLPITLLGAGSGHDVLVVELGMNHPGEIDAIARIASPTVGAITNVAPAHLGPMGSIEAIARAKGELFDRLRPDGVAIVNVDDAHCVAQSVRFAGRKLHFGAAPRAQIRLHDVEAAPRSVRFALDTPQGATHVAIPRPGLHLAANGACAAAAALATERLGDRALEAIRDGLARFHGTPGRLEPIETARGVLVLDDSYNANPASAKVALRALAAAATKGRAVAVLGDMLELGPDEAALHAEVGRAVAESGVAVLVAVGPRSAHTARAACAAGVPEVVELADSEEAARRVPALVREGDVALVKGSRGMRMERVVAALEGRC